MLRGMAVMALALGGLSVPAQAEDVIRLFAPVPAGKIVLSPPAGRTAHSPPRPLVVRAAPPMRGSLKDGEPRPTTPAANTPWLVAPQTTPKRHTRRQRPAHQRMIGRHQNHRPASSETQRVNYNSLLA